MKTIAKLKDFCRGTQGFLCSLGTFDGKNGKIPTPAPQGGNVVELPFVLAFITFVHLLLKRITRIAHGTMMKPARPAPGAG